MNMKCEVIRDLLPLYVDGVVSEESRKLIEEHLAECADCREYCNMLQEEIPDTEDMQFADENASLRKIKRKIMLNRLLAIMVTIGFAIAALAFVGAMKPAKYEGTLEENLAYTVPSGYEEAATSSADPENYKRYVRESAEYKETILIYYNGLMNSDFISSKDIINVDPSTEVEINTYDWNTDDSNELYCMIQHDGESYVVEYKCKQKNKENYYSSCSKEQQSDILAFIKTFDYHRPVQAGGNIFSRLHHNYGTGGCIVLLLTLLIFISLPIAIGISSAIGSKGGDDDAVISSRDLHESMNRERKAKGESSLPSINNVQGISSNNLARRDHSWSSVPDFFIKLFRKK